jgi:CubicO group peptidase (beta-lactamase class C family)
MTAPYKYELEPYQEFFASENWVNAALDVLGGDKPIGEFMYSPIVGTHILSGILAKAAGSSILAFATEHLFSPLGIQVPHNVVLRNEEEHHAVMNDRNTTGWVVDPQGINTASWGLFLTSGDMAKIGQLYADGGVWKGKQLVPAEWIEESTREHSRWGELSYGYLWWMIDKNEHSYAALGDGGNVIYVNGKKKLVVSIASLFVPEVKDRIAFIMEHVEPLFGE